jgi:integrase
MGEVAYLQRTAAPRPTTRKAKSSGRDYLTEQEVEKLITAASANRYGQRDTAMILLAYRHGLRVSELVSLRWGQVLFDQKALAVTRAKNGTPSTHPLTGRELRVLRKLNRDTEPNDLVFTSERTNPGLTTRAVQLMIADAGERAGLGHVHPHQLRHGTGFYLANAGHDTRAIQAYLGHRNISNTVRYTALAAARFKDFWRD